MHYVALLARPWAIIVPPRGLQILWLTVVEESWSAVQEGAGRCRAGRAHAKTNYGWDSQLSMPQNSFFQALMCT